MSLPLSGNHFSDAFPFHIGFDRELRVVQFGQSLLRLVPDLARGRTVLDWFEVERPDRADTFEAIRVNLGQVFILRRRTDGLRLRGQMVFLEDQGAIVFLGAPWFDDIAAVRAAGLNIEDFAVHDPVVDLLQVLQLQKNSVSELKGLAGRLTEQRSVLKATNLQLQHQFEQQRLVESQREELLDLLHTTLESTADGIVVTSTDGRVIRFNRRFLDLWKLCEAELLSMDSFRLRHVMIGMLADPAEGEAAVREVESCSGEGLYHLFHLKDGRVVERFTRPMVRGAEVVGRVWCYRDITATWKIQDGLRLSEERYRAVTEAASDGIVSIDTERRILYANTGMERIFGYSREELLAMTFSELVPPELREAHERGIARYVETGVRRLNWPMAELEGLRKDGTRVPVQISIAEARVEGRRWFTSVIRDVTAWREATRALEESERKYRSVTEGVHEVIFQVDKGRRWTFLNPAWAEVTGYPVAESIGRDCCELFDPTDSQCLEVRQLLSPLNSSEIRRKFRVVRRDGSRRWLEMVARPALDEAGRSTGFSGILADVTEKIEWEAHLGRALEEAEAANRAKTEFLASISHEIRTPLNAIVGMSELMSATGMTPEQEDYQATVRASADSLLHLVTDLLDVSRIEAGQVQTFSSPFDPVAVCEECVNIVIGRARQKQILLHCYAVPAVPPHVEGDRNRVRQILVNLVSNALKFTHQGRVTLSLHWRDAGDDRVDLEFRVTDTGQGIAPEDRQRIFSKFVQVAGPAPLLGSGVGLGLTISQSLAEVMGGTIELDSEPGKGSSFSLRVTLPRAQGTEEPDRAVQDQAAGSRALMLVPDGDGRELAEALEAWGVTVTCSGSPDDAAKKLAASHFDFITVVGNWREAAADMLGEAELRNLPLLLAARPGVNHEGWLDLYGNCEFLEYPATPSRLRAVLSRVLQLAPGAAEPADPVVPVRFAARTRILVAEDNADNVRLLRLMLAGERCQVDCVGDGRSAVEAAARIRYDAILMDLQMPEMNGLDAARAIRERETAEGLSRVPIVAITAHAMPEYRERCDAAGMDRYLSKPMQRAELLATLAGVLDPRPVVLAVDDEPMILHLLEAHFAAAGRWRLLTAATPEAALDLFRSHSVSMALIDLELGRTSGLDLAAKMSGEPGPPVPMVVMSGHVGPRTERLVSESGCEELLEKPFQRAALLGVVEKYAPSGVRRGEAPVEVERALVPMVPMFLEHVRQSCAEMRILAVNGDAEAVRRLAHRVQGAGGGYAFPVITRLGRELEAAACRYDFPAVGAGIQSLEEYLATVQWKAEGTDSSPGR